MFAQRKVAGATLFSRKKRDAGLLRLMVLYNSTGFNGLHSRTRGIQPIPDENTLQVTNGMNGEVITTLQVNASTNERDGTLETSLACKLQDTMLDDYHCPTVTLRRDVV